MAFKMVSAVPAFPHRCEFCTSGAAPFIDTEMPRPSGGNFHLCAICWGQVLLVRQAVARDQYLLLEERIKSMADELASLNAQLVDFGAAQADRDSARIHVEQLTAELSVATTEVARLTRDNQDLRDGHKFGGSEVDLYADAITARVLDLAKPQRRAKAVA